MTPERFEQIEELYHAARARTGEQRAALLSQIEPELRREVEILLLQRSDGGFLDQPAIPSAPALTEASTLMASAVGTSLGPYRIESVLGGGGMGEVFRAVDTRLGRAVAVKVAREQFSARFEREARAISSLNHANICTLYDVGPNYLVMELVEGETIAARLKTGPLPVKTALEYAAQILAALAEAHGKGIVHRDLKPANIMIAKSGVKVLDFGLAKAEQDDTVTASHMVLGTPAYMAPEQRRGQVADARSDIYSFGCVFYEMLTGARVGSHRRLPSRELESIVHRCLDEDPARRWPSAVALEQELAALPTAVRGKRRLTAAMAAVLLIGLAAGAWLLFARKRPVLTDKDTIVLADFTNTTGDPVFDGTLRQGLSVQLEQSPFLSLVSDDEIQQALQMMDRKPDTPLTPAIARELCQRTGSAADLEGSIGQIGTEYLLTVKAVNCSSGETLSSSEAQASGKDHVLDALGRAASDIRNKLGESLTTVQKFDIPLEQATTPSLEAFKAFSSGYEVMSPQGSAAAIPFFKQATELDPHFASAYAWLGVQYTSIGEPAVAVAYTRKAYELRDRASEPERYMISAVYFKEATGNLPAAAQTCKLWMQAYPRAEMPHTYLAGAIYPALGDYEGGLAEARESMRIRPTYAIPYDFAIWDATALNRFDDAKAIYQQAAERKINSPYFLLSLYHLAFLAGDAAGMARQTAGPDDRAGGGEVLSAESDTAAYSGRLEAAREFSRRAVEAAERAGEKEVATADAAQAALREALVGNAPEARRQVAAVLADSPGVDAQFGAALALAYAGDDGRARALTASLEKGFPEATIVQFNYLPTLRAELALKRGDPSGAVENLRAAAAYELGQSTYSINRWTSLYPVYVRGEAYLALHRGSDAAAEFQKILDHRGIVINETIGALARLQLGRAYALAGDTAKAVTAYQDFLALWKNADPDVPVLQQARAEYAKVHG